MTEEMTFEPAKPAQEKPKEDKYKSGLRLAVGVIVLLTIVLAITMITSRSSSVYRAGYVDGWNGCREKQIELMFNSEMIDMDLPAGVVDNASFNKSDVRGGDAQIQIIVD
jgi:hypothetical protein